MSPDILLRVSYYTQGVGSTRSLFPVSSVPLAALMPQRVMRLVIWPYKKFPLARSTTARPVTDKLCSNSLPAFATSTLESDRARASRPGPPRLALRALPESLHHSITQEIQIQTNHMIAGLAVEHVSSPWVETLTVPDRLLAFITCHDVHGLRANMEVSPLSSVVRIQSASTGHLDRDLAHVSPS